MVGEFVQDDGFPAGPSLLQGNRDDGRASWITARFIVGLALALSLAHAHPACLGERHLNGLKREDEVDVAGNGREVGEPSLDGEGET